MNEKFAASLLDALRGSSVTPADHEPIQDARPTPEQKALLDRLSKIVDARAAELSLSAEVLAPRGELKALAMGALAMGTLAGSLRSTRALTGWREQEIGNRLLEAL
jgi:ribonuclease D